MFHSMFLRVKRLPFWGANGAGKTSLINIISGITPMDSGKTVLRGKPVEIRSPRDAKTLGIYITHDQSCVIDTLSIAENIFLGREDSCFVNKKKAAARSAGRYGAGGPQQETGYARRRAVPV